MQRTLAIIKPDGVRQKQIGEVVKRLEDAGFRIIGMRMVHLNAEEAGAFYAVHKERPFYQSLIRFMSSGPCIPLVLETENAIDRLRTLMGATDPAKAAPGTIRRDWGKDVEKNAVHGSDAPQTAQWEIVFFFKPDEIHSR